MSELSLVKKGGGDQTVQTASGTATCVQSHVLVISGVQFKAREVKASNGSRIIVIGLYGGAHISTTYYNYDLTMAIAEDYTITVYDNDSQSTGLFVSGKNWSWQAWS